MSAAATNAAQAMTSILPAIIEEVGEVLAGTHPLSTTELPEGESRGSTFNLHVLTHTLLCTCLVLLVFIVYMSLAEKS